MTYEYLTVISTSKTTQCLKKTVPVLFFE